MNTRCAICCGRSGPRGREDGERDPEPFSPQPVRAEGSQATLAGPGGRAVRETQLWAENLYLRIQFRTGQRLGNKRLFTWFLSRFNTAGS